MNKMEEVAKLLDLELLEDFLVSTEELDIIFRFTPNGLIYHYEGGDFWFNSDILNDLLNGKSEVIKLPWFPKTGNTYYVPSLINDTGYSTQTWYNLYCDNKWYKLGIICKTKEEAVLLRDKMLKVIE